MNSFPKLSQICKYFSKLIYHFFFQNVVGHGRLRSPPSRATCWREGFPNPADYNDNQGFCGGATVIKLSKFIA
jgi:hypothetical protein